MPTSALNAELSQIDFAIAQLDSIVVGKPTETKLALATLLAGGHLLLEDMPGVGKTTLARALAATLGLDWNRIQFTSDLLPADVIGVSIFDVNKQSFRFHEGPVFTSLLLADELNRAPPKTQSALLEAMEEQQVTADGNSYNLTRPFFVIATQNPLEQLGVHPLPESQLDRFSICIELGYPDSNSEREILSGNDRRDLLDSVEPVISTDNVLYWQAMAKQIHTSAAVLDYVQSLLAATRDMASRGECAAGLSPRAGLSLIAMAKAWALLHGRDMVLPDDVQSVFTWVASHRIAGSLRRGRPLAEEVLSKVNVA